MEKLADRIKGGNAVATLLVDHRKGFFLVKAEGTNNFFITDIEDNVLKDGYFANDLFYELSLDLVNGRGTEAVKEKIHEQKSYKMWKTFLKAHDLEPRI